MKKCKGCNKKLPEDYTDDYCLICQKHIEQAEDTQREHREVNYGN